MILAGGMVARRHFSLRTGSAATEQLGVGRAERTRGEPGVAGLGDRQRHRRAADQVRARGAVVARPTVDHGHLIGAAGDPCGVLGSYLLLGRLIRRGRRRPGAGGSVRAAALDLSFRRRRLGAAGVAGPVAAQRLRRGLVAALRTGEGAVVAVDGEQVRLGQDEVVVTETPRSGWAVASDAGETLALDLAVTPELRRAGLARDAVRLIQEGRKRSGLQVADRIELWWAAAQPDGELARALVEHAELVAREVLAVSYEQGRPNADIAPHCDEELGLTFWLRAAGE